MYAFAPIKFPSAYSKIDSHASLERWVDMILKPEAEMGGYETCKPEADEILQIFDNYINILALMTVFLSLRSFCRDKYLKGKIVSNACNILTETIWEWAIERVIW